MYVNSKQHRIHVSLLKTYLILGSKKTFFIFSYSRYVESVIEQHGGPKEAKTTEVIAALKAVGIKPFEVEMLCGGMKLGPYMGESLTLLYFY